MTKNTTSVDKKVKLGLFFPARNPGLATTIADNPGFIDESTREGLLERLGNLENVEVTEGIDFRKAVAVNGKVFVGDTCLNDFDLFAWYAEIDPTPTSYHLEILETLAKDTVVMSDPSAMRVGLDKYLAHTKLKNAGISVADFALFPNDISSYTKIIPYLNQWGELLIKPRLGSFGQGIIRISDESTFRDVVGYTRLREEGNLNLGGGASTVFVEKFYPNDTTAWCSTTIIGGDLVYGYRKKPEKFVDDWKVFDENEIGGCVDYIDPSPEHKDLALRAADVMGLDVIGFDIIKTIPDNKLVIIDENTFPGFYPEIFSQIGKNPAEIFYVAIKKKINTVIEKNNREIK